MAHLRRHKTEIYRPLDLSDMVRLTRKSLLRLPPDYAPFPLVLPTCLRASAQFIAENARTGGLFRVSGSEKVIKAFSQYYDYDTAHNDDAVFGTVCRSTLPTHIPHTIHDVASTFKRFLSRLPEGILGSSTLFDVLVSIHSQLDGPSELSSADRAKVRARLIALAIETIKSKSRRHVICAVFGLLNMVGRITELSHEEHRHGRPLPSEHKLMDYSGLGVCIGPLLLGGPPAESAPSTSGLLPFSLPPKWHRRQMLNVTKDPNAELLRVKYFMTAAIVSEMLITHWRDVVYELNDLNNHARHDLESIRLDYSDMPPFSSDPYIGSLLVGSDALTGADPGARVDRVGSPEPRAPTRALRRERSWQSSQASIRASSMKRNYSHPSLTSEEASLEKAFSSPALFLTASAVTNAQPAAMSDGMTTPITCSLSRSGAIRRRTGRTHRTSSCSFKEATRFSAEDSSNGFTQSMSMGAIPPRVSSRHTMHFGVSEMTPTFETESRRMASNQTPLTERSLIIVRERPVEESVHRAVRSPLADRLREKGRAFKKSFTRTAELLDCSMQPSSSFDDSSSRLLEHEAMMSRPCRPLPPLFPNVEVPGDDGLSVTEMAAPRYQIELTRDDPPIVYEQENNETRVPRYLVDFARNNPPIVYEQGNNETRASRHRVELARNNPPIVHEQEYNETRAPRYLVDFARNNPPIVYEQENNETGKSHSRSRGYARK